jgi:hypothetical protein
VIECFLNDRIYTWGLADGKISRKDVKTTLGPDDSDFSTSRWVGQRGSGPGGSGRSSPAPIEIGNDSFVLTWLPQKVSVRSHGTKAEPRTIWTTSDPHTQTR